MVTLDQFLKDYSQTRSLKSISHRDDEILSSLSKQMSANVYVTERQANLALKIIKENLKNLELPTALVTNPVWERSFRVIERYKYLHVVKSTTTDRIFLELGFNTNKNLAKKLENLRKIGLRDSGTKIKNNVWQFSYSEVDLYKLVDLVKDQNFEISSEILEAYEKISEILSSTDYDKIYIDKNCHENLKKSVEEEIGPIDVKSILLEDRKIKYQYEIFDNFHIKTPPTTLTEKIARRNTSKIYLSSTQYALTEIINSLTELNRFPVLVVFDASVEKSMKNLEILSKSLFETNCQQPVGIYFRYDNDAAGKPFNESIAQLAYNMPLNNNTGVVGITNQKIPKFLLKMKWQPKSIIVLASVLGSNRVNCLVEGCDLVIFHQDKKPLRPKIEEIV